MNSIIQRELLEGWISASVKVAFYCRIMCIGYKVTSRFHFNLELTKLNVLQEFGGSNNFRIVYKITVYCWLKTSMISPGSMKAQFYSDEGFCCMARLLSSLDSRNCCFIKCYFWGNLINSFELDKLFLIYLFQNIHKEILFTKYRQSFLLHKYTNNGYAKVV